MADHLLVGPVGRIGGLEPLELDLRPQLFEMFGQELLLRRHRLRTAAARPEVAKLLQVVVGRGAVEGDLLQPQLRVGSQRPAAEEEMIANAASTSPLTATAPRERASDPRVACELGGIGWGKVAPGMVSSAHTSILPARGD